MKGRKFRFLDDMWVLKISIPGRITWEALGQRGQIPGTRAYHHLCYISRRLYLFGGKKAMEDKRVVSGMHVYDYSVQCWYQQRVDGAENPCPFGSSASVVDDQIFTFGGILDGKVTATTHLFDPQTSSWSALRPSGSIPPARCDHGACTMKSSIFVHGGCAGADVFLCDLYELDTNTLLWTRLEFGGVSNIPRAGHTLTAHHGKDLYVFGGFNDHIYPDGGPVTEDLCKYSLRQKRWKTPLALPEEYEPCITYNHSAVIVQNNLYIVGGLALDGMANDVQVARLISPSERTMAPEEVRHKAFDSGFISSGIYDYPPAPIADEIYSTPMERKQRPRSAVRAVSNARMQPLRKLPDIERRSEVSSRSVDSTEVRSRSASRASLDPVVSEIFIEPTKTAPAAAAPERGPRRLSSPPPIPSQAYDEGDEDRRGSRILKSPPPGLSKEDDEDDEGDESERGHEKLRSPPPDLSREDEEDAFADFKLNSPPPGPSRGDDEDEKGHEKLRSPPPCPSREDDKDERGHPKLSSPPPSPSRGDDEDEREHPKLKSPSPSPSRGDDEDEREHPKLKSPPPSPSRGDDEDERGHPKLKSPPPSPSRKDDEDERGHPKLKSPPPSPSQGDDEDEKGHPKLKSPSPSPSRGDDEDERGHPKLKSPSPSPSRGDDEDERGHSKLKSPSPSPSRGDDEDDNGNPKVKSPPPSTSGLESGRQAPEPPDSASEAGEEEVKERKESALRASLQNLNALEADREVREEDASTTSDNASSSDSSDGDTDDEDSSSGVEVGEKEEKEEEEDEFSFSLSKRPETAKPDEDGRAWSEDIYDELEAPNDADNGNADEDDSEQSGDDEQTLTTSQRQQLEQLSAQLSSM